ncbi:hypothetical protein YC2023_001522 [Brassica napus]
MPLAKTSWYISTLKNVYTPTLDPENPSDDDSGWQRRWSWARWNDVEVLLVRRMRQRLGDPMVEKFAMADWRRRHGGGSDSTASRSCGVYNRWNQELKTIELGVEELWRRRERNQVDEMLLSNNVSVVGPTYGRRVSVRTVAGGRLLPSNSFIFCSLRRPSTIALSKLWIWFIFLRWFSVWREDAVGLGAGVSNLVRRSVVLIPGHGSYPSSVVAGLLREVEAFADPPTPASVPGKRRLTQLRLRRLLAPRVEAFKAMPSLKKSSVSVEAFGIEAPTKRGVWWWCSGGAPMRRWSSRGIGDACRADDEISTRVQSP